MRKSLPEARDDWILAFVAVLVPFAFVLLGRPVLHFLVLLRELLLHQAAHALLLAVLEPSFVDIVVAL